MLFLGVDWAEHYHAACLLDEHGVVLASAQIEDTIDGVRRLQEVLAQHITSSDEVLVGIETERGLLVRALLASGFQLYALNPLSVKRYRERYGLSRAKSDPADAKLLAHIVRTDHAQLRPIAGDSLQVEALTILARSHQALIWARQRQANQLRSALREFYPGALEAFEDLASRDACAILAVAPTPTLGRLLSRSRIASRLRAGGRQRYIERTTLRIYQALRAPQLEQPQALAAAFGIAVAAHAKVIAELTAQIAALEQELTAHFEHHPDAEILLSLPGLGPVLGARMLAEFGDDPVRYADSKARKNVAGTSPITRASGRARVVSARYIRNARLADACSAWAFSSLRCSSGARQLYDRLRRNNRYSHHSALRTLANRLVGIYHGCLAHRTPYSETLAWSTFHAATP